MRQSFALGLVLAAASAASAQNLMIWDTDGTAPIAELTALGHWGSIGNQNINSVTPTLGDLAGYDVVFAYTDFPPADPTACGDVLADFVDQGGCVVVGTYGLSNPWAMGGRIMTSGYCPLTNLGINGDVSGLFNPIVGGDPAFNTPNAVNAGAMTYFHNGNFAHPGLDAGATLLADDGAGIPLYAVNANGHVGGLNMFGAGGNFGGNNQEFYNFLDNALLRCIPTPGASAILSLAGLAAVRRRR